MKKAIVIISGGMDSVAALYWAKENYDEVEGLSFNYGSKHNEREIPCAKLICDLNGIQHKVINLDFINELFKSDLLKTGGDIPEGHYEDKSMKSTVVPFRNGIMLSIATGYAESVYAIDVIIGSHSGDHAIYPDCGPEFTEAMNLAANEGTYEAINIVSPFNNYTKDGIVSWGVKRAVPYDMTWSCYKGNDKHCGKCGTCVERKEAFKLAKVEDPTEYE